MEFERLSALDDAVLKLLSVSSELRIIYHNSDATAVDFVREIFQRLQTLTGQ